MEHTFYETPDRRIDTSFPSSWAIVKMTSANELRRKGKEKRVISKASARYTLVQERSRWWRGTVV